MKQVALVLYVLVATGCCHLPADPGEPGVRVFGQPRQDDLMEHLLRRFDENAAMQLIPDVTTEVVLHREGGS